MGSVPSVFFEFALVNFVLDIPPENLWQTRFFLDRTAHIGYIEIYQYSNTYCQGIVPTIFD